MVPHLNNLPELCVLRQQLGELAQGCAVVVDILDIDLQVWRLFEKRECVNLSFPFLSNTYQLDDDICNPVSISAISPIRHSFLELL